VAQATVGAGHGFTKAAVRHTVVGVTASLGRGSARSASAASTMLAMPAGRLHVVQVIQQR
jgi:hypothetical protein